MCSIEELEALLAGELDDEARARVQAHLGGCASCKDELKWLQAEAELMARRRAQQAPVAPEIWQGIAERIAQPEGRPALPRATAPVRTRRWGLGARIAYGTLLASAAAAVVFATWPGQMHHTPADFGGPPSVAERKKVAPEVTLDRAEQEYQAAAKVLEAEYQEGRGRLPPSVAERYDRMLLQTRARVADAHTAAGSDVDGRMVVLDGYAEYLRSLQTIVSDIR